MTRSEWFEKEPGVGVSLKLRKRGEIEKETGRKIITIIFVVKVKRKTTTHQL